MLPRPPPRLRRAAQRGRLARPRTEHVALTLQQTVGHDSAGARAGRSTASAATTNRLRYVDEQVGLAAGKLAVRLVNGLVAPRRGVRLREGAGVVDPPRRAHGVRPIHAGDRRRGGLARRPVDPARPALLVQLGQGVHAKRIRATMTSETSAIAVGVTSDKDLTARLLGAAGLPGPKQESRPPPNRRCARPTGSASRSWSGRSTATTAVVSLRPPGRRRHAQAFVVAKVRRDAAG